MDGSDGKSGDLSDAAMETGSVADSEISYGQTVSTLYPDDSISQRGEHGERLEPSSSEGSKDKTLDIHSFNSEGE